MAIRTTNTTRAKDIDEKFFGVEPSYNLLTSDVTHLIKGLNYYAYTQDIAKSKEWALKWVKEQKPELYPTLSKVRDFDFENRGFVCRMIERGYCLSEKQAIEHDKFFIRLSDRSKTNKPVPVDKVEQVKTIKPINKINQCLSNIDNTIQDVFEGKPKTIKVTDNKEDLKQLIVYCDNNLQEMIDNSDGYRIQTLRLLRGIYNEYKDAANKALVALTANTTRMKAPVKASAINPAKMTKDVKYLKSFNELKLVSIPPTSVIGGKKLYAYDVVTRKLRSYVSNADAGFMFTGSSIRNFDPVKSVAKTIRNPEAFFSRFKDGILISDLNRVFKELTTTESYCAGRLNENIILLKAS